MTGGGEQTYLNPARFETDGVDVDLWSILTCGMGGCRCCCGQVSPVAVRFSIPCEPLFWRQQDDHGKSRDRLCAESVACAEYDGNERNGSSGEDGMGWDDKCFRDRLKTHEV